MKAKLVIRGLVLFILALSKLSLTSASVRGDEPVLKIWDKGGHNAFTDLIRFQDRWFCCFREGAGHASGAGIIRVLCSDDGKEWQSCGTIEQKGVDLRDPHLSTTPDNRLMLNGGAAFPASRDPVTEHYSFVSFSKDGADWTAPQRVVGNWEWLWRVRWNKGVAYGVAYGWEPTAKPRTYHASLYHSKDGIKFEPVTKFDIPQTTEATLAFDGDTALCLQRRDGTPNSAMLGRSEAPYTKWHWQDLGESFGGPNLIKTPDGIWLAAGRVRENGKSLTAVCRLDVAAGKLVRLRTLPSGGDNSYPGMVWHDGRLWVSYYSSHEGKTSIYLTHVAVSK